MRLILALFIFFANRPLLADSQSLFERMLLDINKSQTNKRVTYPISSLIEKIERTVYHDEKKLLGLVLKESMHTNIKGDNKHNPFIIYSFVHEGEVDYMVKDRIFMLYQDYSKNLEVISYDEKAGRYSFLKVDNYSGAGENKIQKAKVNSCVKCHKNLNPIFESHKIYKEKELTQKLISMKNDDKNPRRIERFGDYLIYNGIETQNQQAKFELLKTSIENAQKITDYNSSWKKICSFSKNAVDIRKCRSRLLHSAFLLSLDPMDSKKVFNSDEYRLLCSSLEKSFANKNLKVIDLEEQLYELVQYLSTFFPFRYHNYLLKFLSLPKEKLPELGDQIFLALNKSDPTENKNSLDEDFPVRSLILKDIQSILPQLDKR